jgi:hypothetical protein
MSYRNREVFRDGATIRQRRLLTICQLVEDRENTDDPLTVDSLQTIMTLVDGLTRARTEQYVRELKLSGVLGENGSGALKMKRSVAHIIGLIAKKQAPELSTD